MNDELPQPAKSTTSVSVPRETLTGDRACTQCLHPLVGRAIEREPSTGLLYVRCGECGSATAIMEYPSGTPWLNRMKSVVATGFIATMIAAIIALACIAGGFSLATCETATDISAGALASQWETAFPSADRQSQGRWDNADLAWLATPAGQSAITMSRFNSDTIFGWGIFVGLSVLALTPFAMALGMVSLRRSAVFRACAGALPVLVGCTVFVGPRMLVALALDQTSALRQPTWAEVASSANYPFFAGCALIVMATVAAIAATLAPQLAAIAFRAILPPRDRRLVAWIWEWRNLPVPRDP